MYSVSVILHMVKTPSLIERECRYGEISFTLLEMLKCWLLKQQ